MKKEKCMECVWADKINDDLIFCIFPKCIKGESKDAEPSRDI